MSNAGSIPPSPPSTPASYPQGAKGDVRATILEMPETLQNIKQPARLIGEVVGNPQSGRLTIRTDSGDIEMRIPPDRAPPQGARVEIDLPAGNPPPRATIRPAPAEQKPAPPQDSAPPSDRVELREDKPPVDRPPTKEIKDDRPPPPPHKIEVGEDIRLRPLPKGEKIIAERPAPLPFNADDIFTQIETRAPLGDAIDPRKVADENNPKAPLALLAAKHHMLEELLQGLMPLSLASLSVSDPRPSLSALPLSGAQMTSNPLVSLRINEAMGADMRAAIQNATLPENLPKNIAASLEARIPALHNIPAPSQITLMPLTAQAPSVMQHMTGAILSFLNGFIAPEATQAPPAAPITTAPLLDGLTPPAFIDMRVMHLGPPETVFMNAGKDIPVLQNQAGQITAHVAGFTAQGLPVLSLPPMGETAMVMEFDATNITKGSILALWPQTQAAPTTGLATAPPPAPAAMPFTYPDIFWNHASWPLMDDLTTHMRQAAPVMLTTLSATTPNPASPAQLPAAALLFIAAARAGDVGGWLSDKGVESLRRAGKGELLARLGREMGAIGRLLSPDPAQTSAQEWRGVPLPLYYEGDLHKALLWFRQENAERDHNGKGGGKAARFIFDLALSRMGNVQLDGLFRGQRIDLTLRTEKTLSENMRQMMRQKYYDAVSHAGFSGELSFQHQPEDFIKINVG